MMKFLNEETIKTIASDFNAYCTDELNKLIKYKEIIDDDDVMADIVIKKENLIKGDFEQLVKVIGLESVNLYECRNIYTSVLEDLNQMAIYYCVRDDDEVW